MQLIIFEDQALTHFYPLTLTRPVYWLRTGFNTLQEKIVKTIVDNSGYYKVILFCRDYLAGIVQEQSAEASVNKPPDYDDDVLMINGSVVADSLLLDSVRHLKAGEMLVKDGRVVVAVIPRSSLRSIEEFGSLKGGDVLKTLSKITKPRPAEAVNLLSYPWELVEFNGKFIESGFARGGVLGYVDEGVKIYGDKDKIYVGEDAYIESGVVLDARKGPIYIGEETYVESFSRIEGPTYIGRGTRIFGAQIRPNCSIGEVCRIGGEVEASIFHAYANKRHYGYVGHSYIGEWVNLGAGTTNSNLKNTYGEIRMKINNTKINTGKIFIGCFIGDHVKTAIGTLLFSGRRIGVSSHLYGLIKRDIPSFTACFNDDMIEIYLESAVETARRVMRRRGKELSQCYENMIRHLFDLTVNERRESRVKKGTFLH